MHELRKGGGRERATQEAERWDKKGEVGRKVGGEKKRGADNKKTLKIFRKKVRFARYEETRLYVLIYNAEFVFPSTEKAQLRDPYVCRAPVVVPSFHP